MILIVLEVNFEGARIMELEYFMSFQWGSIIESRWMINNPMDTAVNIWEAPVDL